METLRTVLREVLGLFVDDGIFAVAILGWLLAFRLLAPLGAASHPWSGAALFAGFALILLASVIQRARK